MTGLADIGSTADLAVAWWVVTVAAAVYAGYTVAVLTRQVRHQCVACRRTVAGCGLVCDVCDRAASAMPVEDDLADRIRATLDARYGRGRWTVDDDTARRGGC